MWGERPSPGLSSLPPETVYIVPQQISAQGHFSVDLAQREKRHCLMNLLPPPSLRPGDLGPLGTESKILAWPSKDLLSLITAGFGSFPYCPFGL